MRSQETSLRKNDREVWGRAVAGNVLQTNEQPTADSLCIRRPLLAVKTTNYIVKIYQFFSFKQFSRYSVLEKIIFFSSCVISLFIIIGYRSKFCLSWQGLPDKKGVGVKSTWCSFALNLLYLSTSTLDPFIDVFWYARARVCELVCLYCPHLS